MGLVLVESRRYAPWSWCPIPARRLRRTGLPAARLDAYDALAAEYGATLWVLFEHHHEGETRGALAGGVPEDQRNWLSGELFAFVDYDALAVWPAAQ